MAYVEILQEEHVLNNEDLNRQSFVNQPLNHNSEICLEYNNLNSMNTIPDVDMLTHDE